MKIVHKLWLMLTALVAIVWIVGIYAAVISQDGLRAAVQIGAVDEAQTVIESIDHSVDSEIRQWDAYAHSDGVRAALRVSNQRFAELENAEAFVQQQDQLWRDRGENATAEIRRVLAQPLSSELSERIEVIAKGLDYRPVTEVLVTNRHGANAAQSDITGDYCQSDEAWWQIAMRDGRYLGDVELDESSGAYAMDVCLRVDDENGKPLGVMRVVLNVLRAFDVLQRKSYADNEANAKAVTIVNRDGIILASTRAEFIDSPIIATHPVFLEGRIDGSKQHVLECTHQDTGRETLCAVAAAPAEGCLGQLGWHAIIEQDKAIALAPAEQLMTRVLLVAGAASVATLLIGAVLSVGFSIRAKEMLKGVSEFTAGNLAYEIDAKGGDEYATIAGGLNEMASSLRDAHTRVIQKTEELERQNAVLSAEVLERQRTEADLRASTESLQTANAELDRLLSTSANQSAELMRAKSEAEASNRAKSEFLSSMSHELRTPLTAILGFADTLLSEGNIENAPPERLDALRTIMRSGEHLLQLINDILDTSKIEAGRMEVESISCSPLQVARHALEAMEFRAQENSTVLRLHCDTPVPKTISSDPTRVKQILINLIGNAVKFTNQGSVDLHVGYRGDESAGFLEFKVRDSGIGMSREQIARLFQPFTQADMSTTRKFGGTGLGLKISKRLVELLGGEITVSSELGHGSTFAFTIATGEVENIPRVTLEDVASTTTEDMKHKSTDATTLECRVLLAEDGIDNQRLLKFVLNKAGAEVVVVENGQLAYDAAMEALAGGSPFDVILMDMQMPVLDGYGATRKLRESGYALPIVAATAHALAAERDKCLAAGCDDYTMKPINRVELIDKVAYWSKVGCGEIAETTA